MMFVPTSRMLPRALWRPAILFFAVSQFVLAFAPLMEGRFGPDARAHVEQAGTNLHHAHNDADCAACTARGLMAAAEPGSSASIIASSVSLGAIVSVERSDESSQTRQTQPRAPPAV
jgi:hypothetical protein